MFQLADGAAERGKCARARVSHSRGCGGDSQDPVRHRCRARYIDPERAATPPARIIGIGEDESRVVRLTKIVSADTWEWVDSAKRWSGLR